MKCTSNVIQYCFVLSFVKVNLKCFVTRSKSDSVAKIFNLDWINKPSLEVVAELIQNLQCIGRFD